jgi:PAS domain S-box-containing protein
MKKWFSSLSRAFNFQLMMLGYLPLFFFALFIYLQLWFFLTVTSHKNIHQTALRSSSVLSSKIDQTLQHLSFVMNQEENESFQNRNAALSFSPLLIVHAVLFKNSGDLLWEWKKNISSSPSLIEKNTLAKKTRLHHFRKGTKKTEIFFEIEIPESDRVLTALVCLDLKEDAIQSLSSGKTGRLALLSDAGEVLGASNTDVYCSQLSLKKHFLANAFEFFGEDKKNYWSGMGMLTANDHAWETPTIYVLTFQEKKEIFAPLLMLQATGLFFIPFLFLTIYFLNRGLSKWVLSPLEIFYQGIQQATAGNLSFKTQIDSASEMGDLSKSFDSMIAKLNAVQLRLEADKQDLLLLNQNILTSFTTGILVMNHEQKVSFINPAGEQLMGVSFADVQGKKYEDLSIPLAIQKIIHSSLGKNQEIDSMEITLSDRNPPVIFGVKTSFLKQEHALSGLIVSFNDITDRKRMQMELAQNEKSVSLALLSGGMAHDFNNVLNRIKLAVDVLSKDKPKDRIEILEELHDAVYEGQQMTRSLSAFTRNESIVLFPVYLKEFLQEIEKKHKYALHALEIHFQVNVHEDLWIDAEPNYLGQVFQNLIKNAEQALGGNPGMITIALSREDSQALFVVKDSGSGMPAEVLDHLFEPFFSTKVLSSHSGWGLGLALVKSLVEKMKGTISVQSILGEGSAFYVRFPIVLNSGGPRDG